MPMLAEKKKDSIRAIGEMATDPLETAGSGLLKPGSVLDACNNMFGVL